MKRSSFAEEQLIVILEDHAAGPSAAKLCHKFGISDADSYTWSKEYSGMSVYEVSRMNTFEDDNGRLKQLLTVSVLNNATLNEILARKS